MENMLKVFKRDGIVLILVSLIILNCLPQILCAFMMSLSHNFLSNFSITLCTTISYLLSFIIFTFGLSKFMESKNNFKDNIINTIPIAIGYGVIILLTSFFNIFGLDNMLWFNIIHMLLNGMLFVSGLFMSISLMKNEMIVINSKNIIKIFITGICIYFIPELFIGLLMPAIGSVFVTSLITGLLYSLLVWCFMLIFIALFIDKLDYEKNNIKSVILIGIIAVLSIFLFIINVVDNKNNVKTINNMISYSLASGDYAFDEMEVLTAKSFYNDGKEYRCAYLYAVDEKADISGCSSELLDLFKALNSEDALTYLKEKVNNKSANIYDLEALMKLMNESKDKDVGKVTKFLISNMNFTRETVLPFDLTDKDKEKLKDDLIKYDRHLLVRKYIDIYVEWLKQGEINTDVINVANKIASENKDEIALQAAAIKFYIDAGNKAKNGSSNVVDNFVELTKDEISKKSEKDIIAYKNYVVTAYQTVENNTKAIKFLEEFKPDVSSADLNALLLVSYRKNREYEKAEDMALKTLKLDEYNVEALTFMSIYKLQSDLDASINYALKLAKVVGEKKDNYVAADIALGIYRVYLFGYYEPLDSAFCPYHNFYNDMSDEQKALLTNNEILNTYLIGQGLKKENLDTLNKMISKYDYVPYFYYYRGVYEVNNKEYESAVKDLEKAIELGNNHPFFYSELGFAYEGVGDLKKSLEAFEIADSKIDEYGLGSLTYNFNNIHNYYSVYINNAKHAMYESEGEH